MNDTVSSNQLAAERTELAKERTLMAADRSLMAWVRTALSMISFGFTVYKLLEGFAQKGGDLADPASPRNVGLFLVGFGTVAMLMGLAEYRHRIKALRTLRPIRMVQPTFFMAVIMAVLGLLLFFGILSKLV
jgi:putative membrane protein